jgi:hypothetical protein
MHFDLPEIQCQCQCQQGGYFARAPRFHSSYLETQLGSHQFSQSTDTGTDVPRAHPLPVNIVAHLECSADQMHRWGGFHQHLHYVESIGHSRII